MRAARWRYGATAARSAWPDSRPTAPGSSRSRMGWRISGPRIQERSGHSTWMPLISGQQPLARTPPCWQWRMARARPGSGRSRPAGRRKRSPFAMAWCTISPSTRREHTWLRRARMGPFRSGISARHASRLSSPVTATTSMPWHFRRTARCLRPAEGMDSAAVELARRWRRTRALDRDRPHTGRGLQLKRRNLRGVQCLR